MRSRRAKRKRKPAWYIFWFFIFAILFGSITAFLITLPAFNIERVEVAGARLLAEGEIKKLAQVPIGENLFLTRFGKVKERIMTNPVVENVDFLRIPPGTVIIRVKERKEVAVTVLNERSMLVDANGYIFIPTNFPDISRLPVLNGINNKWVEGNRIVGEVGIKMIRLLREFRNFISPTKLQVDVSNIEEINLLVDDTLRVRIGDSNHLDRKILVFESIFSKIKSQKDSIEYIDVRFPAFPVVKYR